MDVSPCAVLGAIRAANPPLSHDGARVAKRGGMRLLFVLLSVSAAAIACSTEVTTFPADDGGGAGSSSNGSSSSSASGGPDFGACTANTQCILQAPGCCEPCVEPTLETVEPINQSQSQAFREATCESLDAPCPACASQPNPNLFAYCSAGQCEEADVETERWNECERNSDCRLRVGTGCCEPCHEASVYELVAVPVEGQGALLDKVCDGDVACFECAPTYPTEAEAVCDQGACKVRIYDF